MSGPQDGPRPKVVIDGVAIDNVSMTEAVAVAEHHIQQRKSLLIVTPNIDHLLRLRRDEEFRRAYSRAGLVIADGMPLIWLSQILGTRLKERVSGSDFLVEFCRVAARQGHRIFLMGGVEGIVQEAAGTLERRFPGLKIAGTYSPTQGFDKKEDENRRILETVRGCRPDILFVGAGAPKQEIWILHHWRELHPAVCIGVGAAFDFLTGRARRAPRWMRNAGLEWFWRLVHEPHRLFRRYILDDLPFFLYLLFQTSWRRLKGTHGQQSD